jgi:chromosome transmission fidelity protein 18
MKAKEWKSHQFAATHSDTFATSRRAQAPDVQLMEFGRTAPRCIAVRSFRYKYGRPIAGAKVVSMTLSEGMRVYFPVENSTTQQKPQQSESQIQKSVLGISIEALLRRVNTMRRQKEHEKTQELRNYEEEEGELQQEGEERRSSDNNMLWVDKHAPTTFSHLLSDERTNREVLRAVRAWDPYVFHKEPPPRPQMKYASKQETQVVQSPTEKATRIKKDKDRRPDENSRVILLAGPCGCGKTTLANIISRHAGYRPIQINGSDDRSANILTEHLVRAMESSTLNFAGSDSGKSRPNCIIMDEIDGADAKEIKALVDIIQADVPGKGAKRTQFLRRPIIFICNNKWAPALRPLLPFAKQFDVSPPSSVRLVSRLQAVLKHEGLTVSGGSSMLNNLVTLSSGDIRSCLYTLQFVAYRARELSARQKRIIGDNEDIGQSSTVDIGEALTESLGGNGLKDERRDAAGTLAVVFRKEKTKDSTDQSRSIDRVLKSVTVS